jgi:hypothetical protein
MFQPLDLYFRMGRSRGGVPFIRQPRDAVLPRALRSELSFLLALSLLVAIASNSCGGLVSSSSAPAPVIVTVSPASAQPFAGTTVSFTAQVQNAGNSAVSWQVNSSPGGNATIGTVSDSGVYTAPDTVPTPPTVTITAVLQTDPSKSASSSVTILSQSLIRGPLSIVPGHSSLTTSQTLQMQVTTAGVKNDQVNWSVDGYPNGNLSTGTISATGLYSPPSAAGAHLILASLKLNANSIGSAQVEVTDFAGTLTWRNDNSRSGQNTKELVLAPGTVNSSTFGKLFSCTLDANPYAQPLYVSNLNIPGAGLRNVIVVATAKDTVFAFDADANPCLQLWKTSLIPAGQQAVPAPNFDIPTDDISPFIGITGTPVIDANSGTIYVVAETQFPQNSSFQSAYHELLYALDLATGQPKIQPAGVPFVADSAAGATFNSLLENQRAALLLDNGQVYVAFGSHHGLGDYHGWLFSYDASTLQPNSVFNVTPKSLHGGIWQSGGGPSADSNHNLYMATGNGTFDVNLGSNNFGESFLRLNTAGTLSVADYFSPCDQQTLSATNQEIGSSAPVLLPDSAGSPSQPHLMIGGGKNGSIYLLNRDNLGAYSSSACPDSPNRVQVVPVLDGPIFSTPLFWNNSIYVAAGNGKLKAFPMSGGALNPVPVASQSSETLGPQGATPVLSSNQGNNAIIWLIDSSGAHATPNTPAVLRAFDAANLSNEIYNGRMLATRDSAGLAVRFTVPTVANGKVYVGTQSELDVYGLLH